MALLNKNNPNKYVEITLTSDSEQLLKKFLKKYVSKTQYLSLVRTGKLLLNGVEIEDFNIVIKENDVVTLKYKRQKLKEKFEDVDFSDLDILYEDDHVLVVNKDYNAISIDSMNTRNFKVVAKQVASYFVSKRLLEPIHVLTRLDADTSGCMLFAKDGFTHSVLSKQQEKGLVNKEYKAICLGEDIEQSIIEAPIGRVEDSILARKVDFENGKYSKTEILDVEKLSEEAKLLTIKLHTGRTHQIRVHLQHVGNEIIGDTLYGTNNLSTRQFLHCSKIEFYDVETNELRSVVAPLKDDMNDFIAKCAK